VKYAAEELKTLREWVGYYPLGSIAKKLNRTTTSIEVKLTRLGISNTKSESGLITAGELANIINVDRNTVMGWILRHGLKSRKRVTRHKKVFTFINLEDFWSWADANKEKVDFSKIPDNSLPPEPHWVEQERKNNKGKIHSYKNWTIQEEKLLLHLYKAGLSKQSIAKELGRSVNSIQKKICRINK
jgi:hypothetical protein